MHYLFRFPIKVSKSALVLLGITGSLSADVMTSFPLSQVRLGDGIFKDSMDVNRRVIDEIGDERALYCFRFQAKLPTGDAKPLGGWAAPEPNGPFPGFYEGHYLSGLSLMAAQTGDPKLRERVDHFVAELAKCQKALGGEYLFASPEVEFEPNRLDGVVWYRMHKLMEGLLAAHREVGNAQSLEVLNHLADWIDQRVKGYGNEFETVKKTEYGGMTEAFENLFAITGNPRDRELAHAWEQKASMIDPFHDHKDVTQHANTLLAKMVGAARIAEVEGDEYHLLASRNFWDFVAGSGKKTYATGGTSIHEGMPSVGHLADSQSRMPQETCVSYNLLKVTQSLFHLTGEAKYMDYYERSLFNAILGSQDPVSGWKTYYQPLNANTLKDFRSHLDGCYCCNGTGLENPSKYGAVIYSHTESGLRVNLFIASTLSWPEKGLRVKQTTRFPAEPGTELTITTRKPVTMEIGVRIPTWCRKGFEISVNGSLQKTEATPGCYATITRTWKSGDVITCKLPMGFDKDPMPDKANQMAFLYGPLVMVGEGVRPWLGELVGDPDGADSWVSHLDKWFKPEVGGNLHFSASDDAGRRVDFKPYYQVGGNEYFTGYWDVVKKPTIMDDHNLALGKPTQCSNPNTSGSNVEAFMRPGKAVDGQYGGDDDWYVKWFPNGMAPQWITVDLGASKEFAAIEWFPAAEDIKAKLYYSYTVELSDDGEKWRMFDDQSKNTGFSQSYRHEGREKARYVKLTVLPRPGLEGNAARPKIAELKVFGRDERK
jgi:DUF1680 family protein